MRDVREGARFVRLESMALTANYSSTDGSNTHTNIRPQGPHLAERTILACAYTRAPHELLATVLMRDVRLERRVVLVVHLCQVVPERRTEGGVRSQRRHKWGVVLAGAVQELPGR